MSTLYGLFVRERKYMELNLVDHVTSKLLCVLLSILEDTARIEGLRLAAAEGFGPRLSLCFPLGQKRAYYAVLAHLRPFSVSSSNVGNI